MVKHMFKQQYLPCLINENMIGKGKNNIDLFVEKFDHVKRTRHKRFCDAMAKKVNDGGFTDDEKKTIAKIIDYRFFFSDLDLKPSKWFEILQESDYIHDLDDVSLDEYLNELRHYGVDVDELEK